MFFPRINSEWAWEVFRCSFIMLHGIGPGRGCYICIVRGIDATCSSCYFSFISCLPIRFKPKIKIGIFWIFVKFCIFLWLFFTNLTFHIHHFELEMWSILSQKKNSRKNAKNWYYRVQTPFFFTTVYVVRKKKHLQSVGTILIAF